MSEKDETDTPWAPGLDEWHANSADAADKEKEAIEAADFQQMRIARYLLSGGTEDCRGWACPSSMGRTLDWRRG